MSKIVRSLLLTLVVMAVAQPVFAGPLLLCHPFQTGADQSALLPWDGRSGWNSPDPRYEVKNLVADTTRLLAPGAPVLVRMENIRRAAIYASSDPRLMTALLEALDARTAGNSAEALAIFDAGYLVETYRQGTHMHRLDVPAVDGYAMVRRAIAMTGASPDMEFAASLMKSGAVAAEHRRRAVAGAASGSLLAKNLAQTNY